jgi:hypothetical protein
MNITSFYYLQYPDSLPADPSVAASEVYVEVAYQDGDINNFDETYSVTVCTTDYIKLFLETHPCYACRSTIVVSRFEDKTVKEALESILPRIEEYGVKKN